MKIAHLRRFTNMAAVCSVFLFGAYALAQEPTNIQKGPSAEEIANFEKEFGGPPTAFPEPQVARPQFEEPGSVPDEAKQYVDEKDLVAVYCAMTRWKSGQFFAAMDALKTNLVPAVEKVRAAGMDVEMPDIDKIRAEGKARVEAICAVSSFADAERLVRDFQSWGANAATENFAKLNLDIQSKMRAKAEEMRAKVKEKIAPLIEEEKSKIESELRTEAEQLGRAKEQELRSAKTPPDPEAIKAELSVKIQAKAELKKAEIEARIRARVNELIGNEKSKLEDLGKNFEGMGEKINAAILANVREYDKYKTEAFRLRKELVFKILDKNLEEGLKQLDAASAYLDAAKKEDPTLKSAAEIRAEIKQDRAALDLQLSAALEAGSEADFQAALGNFKVKWETIRRDSEKAASNAVGKACEIATAEFGKAKAEMDPGLEKIKALEDKCQGQATDECRAVNEFAPRFSTLKGKIGDIGTQMNMVSKMCADQSNVDRATLIALMKKIQGDAEDLRIYGKALEAEKSKVIAASAAQVCAQVLPQLTAAKAEIAKNDLTTIEQNFSRCRGSVTAECKDVNALAVKFDPLKTQIRDFSAQIAKVENLCATPNEENFERLRDSLNFIKENGEILKRAAQDFQVMQVEKASEKALCRAVLPQMSLMKGEMTTGLNDLDKSFSACAKSSDPQCAGVQSLAPQFTDLKNNAGGLFGKISTLETFCGTATTGAPRAEFIKLLDDLKTSGVALKKQAQELKSRAEQFGKGVGVWIEAEAEVRSSLLPKTESWHSHKWTAPASWRPPLFGGYWYLSRGGEYLFYEFNAPQAGKYNVWIRDYVDKFQQKGVRIVDLDFDGKRYGSFPEVNIPAPSEIGVIGWHKVGDGIQLSAGKHTMKVMKDSTTAGAAILDAYYLTTGNDVPSEKK